MAQRYDDLRLLLLARGTGADVICSGVSEATVLFAGQAKLSTKASKADTSILGFPNHTELPPSRAGN